MRVGILGGTFDPPHIGHLLVAVDAVEQLALDRLRFVPNGSQPLKVGSVTAGPAARLAMTRLLAGDDARFEVDPIEIDRGGLSYTVDTLAAFASRQPDDRLFLLVGADVLDSFHQWREPDRVARLAQLVVLRRGGQADGLPESARGAADAGDAPIFLETRRLDVSSTEIRDRVRAGKSIRGFVPDSVADYIAANGLYK